MGSRGPAPTPSRVLQLRGTFKPSRRDPSAEVDFSPLTALPKPPGFLDRVAKDEWARVGEQLIAKQLLTETDLAAFTTYCVNVSRVAACEKILKRDGMTITTPAGFIQARPEVAISRQCGVEQRKFAQEFGLTLSARTRVRTPEKPATPKKSGWEDVG